MKRRHAPRPRHEVARDNPIATAVAAAAMRRHLVDFSIHIYLHDDGASGDDTRKLLAHLAWMIGIAAEVAAQRHPGSPQARRLHGAIRTVVQMSVDGGTWRAVHAPALQAAADEAQALMVTFSTLAMRLIPDGDYIAERVRTGAAVMADVAGAGIYNEPAGATA